MSLFSRLKGKITFVNILTNVILQAATIISGLIIPKIILNYFGSNVNGLVSSLAQFLSYITLVEGGITGVVRANLYKPLVEKDFEKVSRILSTANRFYRKIGFIFIIYSVTLASIYPFVVNSEFNWKYIFGLTIILSFTLFVQYMFSLSLKTLLTADKKIYIVSLVQIIIIILNLVLAYISVRIYPSIHILKTINGLLFVLQPIVFGAYIRKKYSINWEAPKDNLLLSERWNGFAINLAAFIHQSTDVSVLTIFTNLKTVSIYSVYVLVTGGLNRLVQSITSAITPSLGHTYAKKDETEINKKLDIYEFVTFNVVGILFTITGLLITPFVMLYTSGVKDTNYFQPLFGVLITLSEALYLIKFPHLSLSYAANKFKELTVPAFVEAIINIVVSIVLVNLLGLIGVAIGTICGMTFRLCYQVYYTSKIVQSRKQWVFYKKLLIYCLSSFIVSIICTRVYPIHVFNITEWVKHAMIYSLIIFFIYGMVMCFFFKNEISFLHSYMKKRK